jgi:predicted SAM-dependent methyltransferase
MLKRIIVNLLGRERANRLSAPYHDWKARRRTRHRLTTLAANDLCINIGCGPNFLVGWINVDQARSDGIDIVWDLRQGLPFPSESCTAIFGEHVIEHIAKEDAARLLRECHRVLQKGGVIRLSTPDAGRYLRSYTNNDGFLDHSSFELSIETPMDRINQMMREYGQHLWTYDAPALTLLLKQAGFGEVSEQQFGSSRHPRMQGIDTESRAFESLYVEAVK